MNKYLYWISYMTILVVIVFVFCWSMSLIKTNWLIVAFGMSFLIVFFGVLLGGIYGSDDIIK